MREQVTRGLLLNPGVHASSGVLYIQKEGRCVTVQELIDRLRTYDPEMEIGINCEKGEGLGSHPISSWITEDEGYISLRQMTGETIGETADVR